MVAASSSSRSAVLRSTLIYSPFLAIALFALSFIVADVVRNGIDGGHIVGIVIVGSVALLLAFQVIVSILDLFSSTVETVGPVDRQWSRNEMMLFHNSYIYVRKTVFRIEPQAYFDIRVGDTVRVVHAPHTSAVESVEVIERTTAL